MESILLIKVFAPTALTFCIGIFITPIVTHYLFQYKVWKKVGGKTAIGGQAAVEFNRLKGSNETKTPRMGGIVIWGSVFMTVSLLFTLKTLLPHSIFSQLDFFSRSQTWIPLSTFAIGALIGFLNDYYDVTHTGRGLTLRVRVTLTTILAGAIGWWFYSKLGVETINLPFGHEIFLGILIIPFFIYFFE